MATGVDNALVLPNDATFYITGSNSQKSSLLLGLAAAFSSGAVAFADGHAFNPSTVKKNKTVLARAALGDEV